MARATWLKDVLEDLRQQGVPVHYVAGWDARGSTTFDPRGIICHDTGGSANSTDAGEIGTLLRGSTSAPPPIAQFYLSRTTGVHLVATGRCNHALTGQAGPLKGLGNTNLIGIEAAANPGRAWPPAQYRWYVLLVAAICRRRGWNPDRNIAAHREHQPGQKIDPAGISMPQFRADIRAAISNPESTSTPGDDMATPTELWTHDLQDDIGGVKKVEPAYKVLLRAADGADAIRQVVTDLQQRPAAQVTMTPADREAIVTGVVGGLVTNTAFLGAVAKAVADENARRQQD